MARLCNNDKCRINKSGRCLSGDAHLNVSTCKGVRFVQYAVKGVSAHDNISTGPFESYAGAVSFLRAHSDKAHIEQYFSDDFSKWADFMIYEIK